MWQWLQKLYTLCNCSKKFAAATQNISKLAQQQRTREQSTTKESRSVLQHLQQILAEMSTILIKSLVRVRITRKFEKS